MKRQGTKPKLLAPAGGEAAFLAALGAGADAIYVGGEMLNARAFAENFTTETLARLVGLAHARGVEVYVTLNTLVTDKELETALAYAATLYEIGVDALIVADVGLASLIGRYLPGFPLHASTQLSLHNTPGAEEVADLGFSQVVPARELSFANIQRAVADMPQEVEVFLHGALCVSHSGQCLFSSLVGGRSGNRGACAQPCRLPYNGGYPLSLKDLSLAGHIEELIKSGVSTLKIEGRMKKPDYVYEVTKVYRDLLDQGRNATREEHETLKAVFSRSGFTDGYFQDNKEAPMTGIRREEDKAVTRERESLIPPLSKIPLWGKCTVREGERILLSLRTQDGREVCVTGETPSLAISHPLTEDGVKARLSKLGNTPYYFEELEVFVDGGLNVSPAALNGLRRDGVAALLGQNRKAPGLPSPLMVARPPFSGKGATALFSQGGVWEALTREEKEAFSLAFIPLWEYADRELLPKGVWLPPVVTDGEIETVRTMLAAAKEKGATHALCGNPGQIALAKEYGFSVVGDFRLNITNKEAANYWYQHGIEDAVLSPELNYAAMRDIGGRAIFYGRIPLMLTERCFMKENGGCDRCGTVSLTDRRGVKFPIMPVFGHRNQILNSLPTYLGDVKDALPTGVRPHFLFTNETAKETKEVIRAYRNQEPLPFGVRRLPKEKM